MRRMPCFALVATMIVLGVVTVFGAPGVGKTTLVNDLNRRAQNSPTYYVAIEEPTNAPHIVELLLRMYGNESATAAIDAQLAILEERAAQMQHFASDELPRHIDAARAANCTNLVVVCDGHPLTDQLYMSAKVETGAITAEQAADYDLRRAALLEQLPRQFATPLGVIEMALVDQSGQSHARRIARRDTVAERGVNPAVFAHLASHSHQTLLQLAKRPGVEFAATLYVNDDPALSDRPVLSPAAVMATFCSAVESSVLSKSTAVLIKAN